ncbi:DUF1559 domain-containing protein, partial [Alienimonas sp. DA493]|uniref:DUF1559 family PulG-like putative transporter n=1 Tax=Alienimonas sp. DA493 TaxID=3373605 RepID=UPI0037544F0A
LECQNNVKNITLALTNKATGDSGKLPHIRDGIFRTGSRANAGLGAYRTWPRVILPQMDARGQDRSLSSLEELHLNGTAQQLADRSNALGLGTGQIQSYVCPDDTANDIKDFGLSYRVNAGYFADSISPNVDGSGGNAGSHLPNFYNWSVAGVDVPDDVGTHLKSGVMHNPIQGDLAAVDSLSGAQVGAPAQLTLDQIGNWDGTTNTLWISENTTAANWLNDDTFGLAFGAIIPDDQQAVAFPGEAAPAAPYGTFTEAGKPNVKFNDGVKRPIPASEHSGGAITVGFCDGRATKISDSISREIYLKLLSSGGSRLTYPRTNAVAAALQGTPLQSPVSASDYD